MPPSSQPQPRPTHIPLPPPPAFPPFLHTPSPSADSPFGDDVQSPFLQFFTAPSTPQQPPSPAAEYFTPPSSPFAEIPPNPQTATAVPVSPSPHPSLPQLPPNFAPNPASSYISPSPLGTDDVYPITVDIINDLILDDGSLTPLEKVYLFCRSKQQVHRSFIVKNMPSLLHDVPPQEAVEYVLPLFRDLVLDPDESVKEDFSRTIGEVMWWFLTHCQVFADQLHMGGGDAIPPVQMQFQTFTPLLGSLMLCSNGNISELARCSVIKVLERIKSADDRDALLRDHKLRPPLPSENLWKPPAPDYALDDPEIEEQDPDIGVFGPDARILVKQEIMSAIVYGLGRLDVTWEEDQIVPTEGQIFGDRRTWLEGQTGDGVQVVSPGLLCQDVDGVNTSTSIEPPASDNIVKGQPINPYFPLVPNTYSTLSSTSSSTPSPGNSSDSSSHSSPIVLGPSHDTHALSLDALPVNTHLPSVPKEQVNSQSISSGSPSKDRVRCIGARTNLYSLSKPLLLIRPPSQQQDTPLAHQISLGTMIHDEEEDIYYDEQVTNGRWSTMRLIAAIASNGTADPETEIYFIREIKRSIKDTVFWVRREAAFAVGALARVVPVEFIISELIPIFDQLVLDSHPDVRQSILFSLPPLATRLDYDRKRELVERTMTALVQDTDTMVRESALDTLSETIYTFHMDPLGPPEFLMQMFLGRKDDVRVRSGYQIADFVLRPPLEHFYLDTKRPLTLAFGFPAVTLTLGRNRWEELRSAYADLSLNRMGEVKRTLAAGLGEIAKVIGAEHCRNDLIQVWWDFLKCKDSATRIRAIENIDTLVSVVGRHFGLTLWEGVLESWQAGVFSGWRERKIILLVLPTLPQKMGNEVLTLIRGIETLALNDTVEGVREVAIDLLPQVLGILTPRSDLLYGLRTDISQLAFSTFRRRMTFASCQTSIFLASITSGQKPMASITEDMLQGIVTLAKDAVADVRISVARFVREVYDAFVRETEPIPGVFANLISDLSTDTSLAVTTFMPQLPINATHVSDETILRRSRHISRPPYSCSNSDATISTFGDVEMVEVGENDASRTLPGSMDKSIVQAN